MRATDELRKMLDERGVDWVAEDDPEEPAYYFVTKWFANGCEQTYEEIPAIRCRSLEAYCVTPEQAIAATLGAGTCHDKGGTDENGQQVFNCSECGCVLSLYDRDGSNNLCTGFVFDYPRYCPSCGRKVEG